MVSSQDIWPGFGQNVEYTLLRNLQGGLYIYISTFSNQIIYPEFVGQQDNLLRSYPPSVFIFFLHIEKDFPVVTVCQDANLGRFCAKIRKYKGWRATRSYLVELEFGQRAEWRIQSVHMLLMILLWGQPSTELAGLYRWRIYQQDKIRGNQQVHWWGRFREDQYGEWNALQWDQGYNHDPLIQQSWLHWPEITQLFVDSLLCSYKVRFQLLRVYRAWDSMKYLIAWSKKEAGIVINFNAWDKSLTHMFLSSTIPFAHAMAM